MEVIAAAVRDLPSVRCEGMMPPIANVAPHLIVTWDEKAVKVFRAWGGGSTPAAALRAGSGFRLIRPVFAAAQRDNIALSLLRMHGKI